MTEADPTAPGLRCGEDLLDALCSEAALAAGGLTVSQLAAITARDRSLVSRIVADLVESAFVDRDPGTRKVRLGWRLYAEAVAVGQERLRRRSGPLLRALADSTGESAYTVVRFGADAVTVAEEAPAQVVVVASWVGRSWPVARSDAGPVLLAELSRPVILELLGEELPPTRAANAPRSMGELLDLVEVARRTGLSVLDEHADVDVASAAAPVRDHRDRTVAAMVATGPSARARSRLDEIAEQVVAAAAGLSRELGASNESTALGRRAGSPA